MRTTCRLDIMWNCSCQTLSPAQASTQQRSLSIEQQLLFLRRPLSRDIPIARCRVRRTLSTSKGLTQRHSRRDSWNTSRLCARASLIGPGDVWGTWAVISSCAAAGLQLENTKFGRAFSGMVDVEKESDFLNANRG